MNTKHNLNKGSICISVPSKTFLLGEYVALKGGPTLILTTSPRFKLMVANNPDHNLNIEGISPESPAGKLITSDRDFYSNYRIQFNDPHESLGGFGASSAQFLMLDALKYYLHSKKINHDALLSDYVKLSWNGEGIPPSGADIIAQLYGGICFFHKSKKILQTYPWVFDDIEYCLLHTRNKIATHVHLKELKNFDERELENIVQNALFSLQNKDSKNFIEAIRSYENTLQLQGLVAEETQVLLKQLSIHPGILASKGCGALGKDVILIIFEKKKQHELIKWLKNKNLNVIIYGQDVEVGLEIHEAQ